MSDDIQAKILKDVRVAKVISNNQLVLNAGSTDGVEKGDKFIILEMGEEVMDPVTGESLGEYEIIKGHAKVFHVTGRLSLVEPVKYSTGGLLSFQAYLAAGEQHMTSDPFKSPEIGDIARYYT